MNDFLRRMKQCLHKKMGEGSTFAAESERNLTNSLITNN